MTEKKLIMFDFDGVLVNTLAMGYAINREVDTEITLPQYQKFFNGNIFKAIKEIGFKGNPDFFRRYAEEARSVTVPIEMKEYLRSLSDEYILSIISGSPTAAIRGILKKESIEHYFSDVLGYEVDPSKAVRIRSLLTQYEVEPKDTIFITDTNGDVYEARECGVKAVAVTWGFQTKEMLAESNPMAFADSLPELDEKVKDFFLE